MTLLTKNVLELAEHTPELQEYLNNKKEIFGKVIESMMKENVAFQSSGLSGKVYNIVPALFDRPKELNNIIDLYEKGNYPKIGEEFFKLAANDENICRYFQNQTTNIKNFAVFIIKENIEQNKLEFEAENTKWLRMSEEEKVNYLNTNEKWKDKTNEEKQAILQDGLPKSIDQKLKDYGISTEDLGSLANIAPILLNYPKELSTVIGQFNQGQYVEMTEKLLSMVDTDPLINNYLKDNQEIFSKVIESVLKDSPALADLEGRVIDIVPTLLDHPQELLQIIELQKHLNLDF